MDHPWQFLFALFLFIILINAEQIISDSKQNACHDKKAVASVHLDPKRVRSGGNQHPRHKQQLPAPYHTDGICAPPPPQIQAPLQRRAPLAPTPKVHIFFSPCQTPALPSPFYFLFYCSILPFSTSRRLQNMVYSFIIAKKGCKTNYVYSIKWANYLL